MPPLNDHETERIEALFTALTFAIEREFFGLPIQGLTNNEIREIQADQGVETLPAYYWEFLRRMGRCAGKLLIGTDAFYPALLGMKRDVLELLRENAASQLIDDKAVVIGMHQGYQAYWLETAHEDNPQVYLYQEGCSGFLKNWPSFSAFLLDQSKRDLAQ